MNPSLRLQIIAFAAIRMVLNTMHRMVYPFLAVFSRGLGVDLSVLSLVLTGRSVVGMFGPFLAMVSDSRGRKAGMLLGLGMFTGGVALVVLWPTYPVFVLSLMLTTLGKYVFDPPMQAYLGDQVPYKRRGLALAVTELGWSLAFIAGIPLMGFLIARQGWMSPFGLLTILGAGAFILIARIIPHASDGAGDWPGVWRNFRGVLRYPPALAGLSIGIAASAANEVINLVFGVWLEDAFGLQIMALGGAAAVIGLSELGGESLVGGLADRLGKERSVGIGLAANSLAALILPLLGRSVSGAVVGLFLFYITFEFTLVSIIPMMTEVMPSARATLMAFNVAGLSLGRAVGALAASPLYAWGMGASAVAAVIFNIVALLALRRLCERDK
ncbi:MAG: MFS transporter [Chloroflexi bacterium]|nr:MFS transporter [Chloroflexota bacterium]MBU1660633.1 MFS transporter [Chloroflexota bacterium]